jgi:hypothetical protein
MKTFLQAAAVVAALVVPIAGAQAQPQGSDEAQGYAQSHGYYSNGYSGYYGRHHRWR